MKSTIMSEKLEPFVKLRAIEPEDLDILYQIENDISLWNVGCTNVPYSRYTLHNYIADCVNDIYTDRQLRMMIENDKAEVVGIIDIIDFEPRHQRAELGVVIKRSFRRQGYASSAVRKIIDYAKNILHLHQVYVVADADNVGSIGLFSSLGFQSKDVLTDWLFSNGEYHNAIIMQRML